MATRQSITGGGARGVTQRVEVWLRGVGWNGRVMGERYINTTEVDEGGSRGLADTKLTCQVC